ncbi:hypothetical protein AB0J47_27670 [Nocardia sp. NPDC049737]|uniref:hypothetical protein n=1 Tax=Nocardia sp. NPDC049737 TaxID=3154358 RepID=UPI003422FA31
MHRPPTGLRRFTRALRQMFAPHHRAVTMRVFLNQQPHFLLHGYTPDAALVLAYTYSVSADNAPADEVLLERAFAAFNGFPEHDDDHTHAQAWAAKRFRSLAVGDVVALDDRYYACQSAGWTRVATPLT